MSDCEHVWEWNEWTGDVCTVCSYSKDEVRIRELEAEVKRLAVTIELTQKLDDVEFRNAVAMGVEGEARELLATLERVRAVLNVKSYDTDPYSDVRVVDVEDLREALGEPGESADAT